MKLVATATFGLESVVRRELAALGYDAEAVRPGWLGFSGDASAIARANLWLRSSDRVLLELGAFPAEDFDALFEGTRALAWEAWLPPSARFPVRGRSVKSRLASVPACQSVVKKAIVERLRSALGARELPEDGPFFPVEVALLEDEARLLLDTSGVGLHKRGYRPVSGGAPLKETLAAGLVLLTVWHRNSPFLDPFCGTGTLPIEAALVARNRAPGLARDFASESWPAIPAPVWKRAREQARDLERTPSEAPIVGSDVDEGALAIARWSAEKAGASEIRFSRRAFEDAAPPGEGGCLVTNPPYGERLGEPEDVVPLYRGMPLVFRRFASWSIYVLTARRDFEKLVGQEARRRRKLFNGPLECTFYQFFGPRPGRERDRPAFGGLSDRSERQAELFRNRLKKRARHLRKWPKRLGTDVYRLYEGDIKEVPLVVDRYGDFLRLAPLPFRVEARTPAEQEDWLDLMARTAAEALELDRERVVLVGRSSAPRRTAVRESSALFEVHLGEDEPPGIEPSDRELRKLLREEASGKRVLVLGSGEGSFGVVAKLGGASAVTLVEPSRTLSSRARRNFELNDLSLAESRFVVSEPAPFLDADRSDYDLALFRPADPGAIDEDLARLRPRLAPGGLVLLVTPHDRAWRRAPSSAGWESEELTERMTPEEHRKRPRSVHRLRKLELTA